MTCYKFSTLIRQVLLLYFVLVREALTNMKKSLDQEIVDLKQKIQELREIFRRFRLRNDFISL